MNIHGDSRAFTPPYRNQKSIYPIFMEIDRTVLVKKMFNIRGLSPYLGLIIIERS